MPRPIAAPDALQPELDFESCLPSGMESFSVRFLSGWFRTSPRHWINLVESGELHAADLRGAQASKSMIRIPRAELVRFLNERGGRP